MALDHVSSLTEWMVAVGLDEDEDLSNDEVLQPEYNDVMDFIANSQ